MSISAILKDNNIFYHPYLTEVEQIDKKITSLQQKIQKGSKDPLIQEIINYIIANPTTTPIKDSYHPQRTLYQIHKELSILCGVIVDDKNSLLNKAKDLYTRKMCSHEYYQNFENRKKLLDEEKSNLEQNFSALPSSEVEHYVKSELQASLDDLTRQLSFETHLQDWCNNNSSAHENRFRVADSIRECLIEKTEFLHLLHLSSFPKTFGDLSHLKSLNVLLSPLPTLPSEISQLVNLESLTFNNQLTGLPPEISQLTKLQSLNVSNNQLTGLPPEISQLTKLQSLNVSNNQLTNIAHELAKLPATCEIIATDNPFAPAAIQAFQEQIEEQRTQNPNLGPRFLFSTPVQPPSPEDAIAFWLDQLQNTFPTGHPIWEKIPEAMISSANLKENPFYKPLFTELSLHVQDKENFTTFLVELQMTQDFINPQTQGMVIFFVATVLNGICSHAEFQRQALAIMAEALNRAETTTSCGDRLALSFNEIEIQWLLYCDSEISDDQSLAKILIGAKRRDLLREFADTLIIEKKFGDPVEVHLHLQLQLKDVLELPTFTQEMLQEISGPLGISAEDLNAAKNDVLAKTSSLEQKAQILASSAFWEKRIKKDHEKKFNEINDEFGEKITKTFENTLLIESEKLSYIEELTSEQKNQTDKLILEISEQILENNSLGFVPSNVKKRKFEEMKQT
jgi:Leucine-rich repeat (LRR) protein